MAKNLLGKTFREKLGIGAELYDSVYASLEDLRVILPNPVPKLTVEEAVILRHNIAVFSALCGNLWLKGILKDLQEQVK